MNILKLNNDTLLDCISSWGKKAGRAAVRPVLIMWYVMSSEKTPRKDKLAIFGSLAYLVLPIDILDSHKLPIIGWLDEAVSLGVLIQKMSNISLLRYRQRRMHNLKSGFLNIQNMK